jgi:hypothetical protein
VQSRQQYGIDLIAPTRADHKWQAKEQQGFDTPSFQIDWDAEKATCPAGCESSSWTPALDRYDNEVIKIKFSSDRLQALRTERALYQSPTPCHLRPCQGTPSSLTRSQGTSKGGGVSGEIPSSIRQRRHHFTRGSCLWSSSQSLSWHGENPFATLDYCDSYQCGPCLGVGGPNAFGEDAHFSLWCFSFGSLSPQVRQQYQSAGEPKLGMVSITLGYCILLYLASYCCSFLRLLYNLLDEDCYPN